MSTSISSKVTIPLLAFCAIGGIGCSKPSELKVNGAELAKISSDLH